MIVMKDIKNSWNVRDSSNGCWEKTNITLCGFGSGGIRALAEPPGNSKKNEWKNLGLTYKDVEFATE